MIVGPGCWGAKPYPGQLKFGPLGHRIGDYPVADPGGDTGVGTPSPQVLILLEKNGKTCNLGDF